MLSETNDMKSQLILKSLRQSKQTVIGPGLRVLSKLTISKHRISYTFNGDFNFQISQSISNKLNSKSKYYQFGFNVEHDTRAGVACFM